MGFPQRLVSKEPTPVFLGFPGGSAGKVGCNVGDLGSMPGLERSLGEGKGYQLQYSGLENSMDSISMGSQRVRHDWATFTFKACTEYFIYIFSFNPHKISWSEYF